MQNKIEFKVCNQGNNAAAYKECEEFIKKWQEILRIQDWQIKIEFVSANSINQEMGDTNYTAFCDREWNNKTAKIVINAEYQHINKNLERTLIHEMLHIVTADYEWFAVECSDKGERTLNVLKLKLEQMVESLSRSFYSFIKEDDGNAIEEREVKESCK